MKLCLCYISKHTAYTTDHKWAFVACQITSYRTHCTFSSCTEHQKSHFHSGPSFRPPLDGGRGWNPGRYTPQNPGARGVWQEFSVSRLHSRFSHTARKQKQNLFPDTIQPTAIHWYPPPTLLRTRDILRLTSNRLSLRFVLKYQCISPGVVPKHHAPYNTPFIRSFFAFLFYIFVFFINHPRFFIRDFVPSFFVSTTSQSAFFPGLTEAQDMVQNGMLWLEHTPPHFLQGQVNQEAVQDTTYPQHEAAACSKVPLHVQGQVVRPGETPGGKNSERKGEKQGQARATEAIKCDQR